MPTLDPAHPINRDIAAVGRISAVPMILRVVSETTGLRFSAVARVTNDDWVACAVHDQLGVGLEPGGTLDVSTTLCSKVRDTREAVVIDHASQDPVCCGHLSPKMYGFESYISVPIFLADGSCFGTICALDPLPAKLRERKVMDQLKLFAELIAVQLDAEARAEAVRDSQQRLQAFVTNAPAAMAVFRGPDLVFELANEGYRRLVGGRDVLGCPAREAIPEMAGSPVWDIIERVYRTGEPQAALNFQARLPNNQGRPLEEVFLDWTAQPTFGLDGKPDGVLFFATDVTETVIGRMALEAKNRELDNFAYIASHDLKSPLRGIGNLAQWLEDDLGASLTESSRSHLGLMRRRVAHMNTLVDGILRFARAGDTDRSRVDVPVGQLLDEVRELVGAGEQSTIEARGEMPTLHTSKVALQQVFLNLVSNAIKHAGRPDAHVVVTCEEHDDRWVFAVADNGPGIAAEHQERVWKLFQALAADELAPSTGIGLSIVKKIVEARHGKVWIESTGEGATFFFTWPKHELRVQRAS